METSMSPGAELGLTKPAKASPEKAKIKYSHMKKRPKVTSLNDIITCPICKGYFIDAVTVAGCGHTFCKTCIVKHIQSHKFYCAEPTCSQQLNKAKPYSALNEDKLKQSIVYKMLPQVYKDEMLRRQKFYKTHPEAKPTSDEDGGNVDRGLKYFTPDDTISISLDLHPEEKKLRKSSDDTWVPATMYLRCPVEMTIYHLKKFALQKLEPHQLMNLEIVYADSNRHNDFTLMEVAYMANWEANDIMRFFYKFKPRSSRRLKDIENKPEILSGSHDHSMNGSKAQISGSTNQQATVKASQASVTPASKEVMIWPQENNKNDYTNKDSLKRSSSQQTIVNKRRKMSDKIEIVPSYVKQQSSSKSASASSRYHPYQQHSNKAKAVEKTVARPSNLKSFGFASRKSTTLSAPNLTDKKFTIANEFLKNKAINNHNGGSSRETPSSDNCQPPLPPIKIKVSDSPLSPVGLFGKIISPPPPELKPQGGETSTSSSSGGASRPSIPLTKTFPPVSSSSLSRITSSTFTSHAASKQPFPFSSNTNSTHNKDAKNSQGSQFGMSAAKRGESIDKLIDIKKGKGNLKSSLVKVTSTTSQFDVFGKSQDKTPLEPSKPNGVGEEKPTSSWSKLSPSRDGSGDNNVSTTTNESSSPSSGSLKMRISTKQLHNDQSDKLNANASPSPSTTQNDQLSIECNPSTSSASPMHQSPSTTVQSNPSSDVDRKKSIDSSESSDKDKSTKVVQSTPRVIEEDEDSLEGNLVMDIRYSDDENEEEDKSVLITRVKALDSNDKAEVKRQPNSPNSTTLEENQIKTQPNLLDKKDKSSLSSIGLPIKVRTGSPLDLTKKQMSPPFSLSVSSLVSQPQINNNNNKQNERKVTKLQYYPSAPMVPKAPQASFSSQSLDGSVKVFKTSGSNYATLPHPYNDQARKAIQAATLNATSGNSPTIYPTPTTLQSANYNNLMAFAQAINNFAARDASALLPAPFPSNGVVRFTKGKKPEASKTSTPSNGGVHQAKKPDLSRAARPAFDPWKGIASSGGLFNSLAIPQPSGAGVHHRSSGGQSSSSGIHSKMPKNVMISKTSGGKPSIDVNRSRSSSNSSSGSSSSSFNRIHSPFVVGNTSNNLLPQSGAFKSNGRSPLHRPFLFPR